MAYRKVDESSLTTVADAIREKGGTSGALTFPDGFAQAISAISAGGGLPAGITALASGSLTPASDVTTFEIAHGLGVRPNFYLLHATGLDDYTGMEGYVVRFVVSLYPYSSKLGSTTRQMGGYMSATSHDYELCVGTFWESKISDYITDTLIKDGGDECPLKGGVTYRWIAGVIDGI